MFEKELGLKVKYGADIGKIKASEFNGHRGYILSDQNGVNYQCRYSNYIHLFLFHNIFKCFLKCLHNMFYVISFFFGLYSVLLVSTGLWVPQQVDFLGSDLVEGYESIPTDPEEFKEQAVLILGKGNSAFETAQSILGRASRIHLYSPSPVRLAWQTHYVGDLRYLIRSVQQNALNYCFQVCNQKFTSDL